MPDLLESVRAAVADQRSVRRVGRIAGVRANAVEVTGLSDIASAADRLRIGLSNGGRLGAEIVSVGPDRSVALVDGPLDGVRVGDDVIYLGPAVIRPSEDWIGRVIGPDGRPFDGRRLWPGAQSVPVFPPARDSAGRRGLGPRLETGLQVFNTILPLARGQRIGLFAGSGVGKTSLLGRFALRVEADVVVVALVGERSREVTDFVDKVLGPAGMKKSVVIAATADQSPLLRRQCAGTALGVAEAFAAEGRSVLLLMDSVSRYAEAHREIALASGETAGPDGFPPSTVNAVARLCERAGPGGPGQADITAVFTVLVPGSDMESPLADLVRGLLDGHVVLDRSIAERGRYPPVNVLRSVSRALPAAATPDELALLEETRRLLGAYERVELTLRAGLYETGADPQTDRAVALWPALDAFAAAPSSGGVSASFDDLRALLGVSDSVSPSQPAEDQGAAGPAD